jgi:hypothetical protein
MYVVRFFMMKYTNPSTECIERWLKALNRVARAVRTGKIMVEIPFNDVYNMLIVKITK